MKTKSFPIDAHFSQVTAINRLAGNYIVPTEETVLHQTRKIILPEVRELIAGITTQDEHETRDGIGDVLFTAAGLYARCGMAWPSQFTPHLQDFSAFTVRRNVLDMLSGCEAICFDTELLGYEQAARTIPAALNFIVKDALVLGQMYGYPVLDDLQAVIDSNFSKFDKTEDDALMTRAKYAQLGVQTAYHPATYEGTKLYVTKVTADEIGRDGKEYPAGKWVKSVNFREPQFSSLVEVESA